MLRSVLLLLTVTVIMVFANPRPEETATTEVPAPPNPEYTSEPVFNYRVNYRWTELWSGYKNVSRDDNSDYFNPNDIILKNGEDDDDDLIERSLNLVCRLGQDDDDRAYENYALSELANVNFQGSNINSIQIVQYSKQEVTTPDAPRQ